MGRLRNGVSKAFALSATLGFVLLAGCSPNDGSKGSSQSADKKDSPANVVTYPLSTNQTFTVWAQLAPNLSSIVTNYGDTPFAKELQKQTGVSVKYVHPAQGQQKEQFNLMIASNQLTDMVQYDWTAYPGGPSKALDDKVILPLNDLIDKYAPNLKKILQEDKELDKMVKTDDKKYYAFPMIRSDKDVVFQGLLIRKDWLDELGLQVPATVDEWTNVLRAFKEKKGATAPFSALYQNQFVISDAFIGAYHTANDFYIDDSGKVKYGPIDPQFKDALKLFHEWYQDGLLDKDFALTDNKALDAKILGGNTGATVQLLSGGLGKYLDTMKAKDPKFNLVGAPYPTLKKGEKAFIGQRDFKNNPVQYTAISAEAKDPATAVKWLDYGYSKEGNMLFNFGIENDSYTLENGVPKFTKKMIENEKYNFNQMLQQYTKFNGPYSMDPRRDTNSYQQQRDAVKLWGETDAAKHLLPPFLTPTGDESKDMAKIMADVTSYKEEMFVKFIIGKESLDNYDQYVKKIQSLGIDKAIKIKQDALARYNKR